MFLTWRESEYGMWNLLKVFDESFDIIRRV